MRPSHVIEIDGLLVAAAIPHGEFYRIVAIDPRIEALDGSLCPTIEEARNLIAVLQSTIQLSCFPKKGNADDGPAGEQT